MMSDARAAAYARAPVEIRLPGPRDAGWRVTVLRWPDEPRPRSSAEAAVETLSVVGLAKLALERSSFTARDGFHLDLAAADLVLVEAEPIGAEAGVPD